MAQICPIVNSEFKLDSLHNSNYQAWKRNVTLKKNFHSKILVLL
jgi:hypothetical protein